MPKTKETKETAVSVQEPPKESPDNPAPDSSVQSAGFCCYIGPTIPGVIQTATIYMGERAAVLERPEVRLALAAKPAVADLIVDGATLPQDRIAVKTPGTDLYRKFQDLRSR